MQTQMTRWRPFERLMPTLPTLAETLLSDLTREDLFKRMPSPKGGSGGARTPREASA